jgi:hypothetical protein
MRKAVVALFVVGLLSGPLANISSAGVVCNLLDKLGYDNVKDCEVQP